MIIKDMRHWPWVCDNAVQVSNGFPYFTFNVKHPTFTGQDTCHVQSTLQHTCKVQNKRPISHIHVRVNHTTYVCTCISLMKHIQQTMNY